MAHRHEEDTVGREIWPATPKHIITAKNQVEIDFCQGLECANSTEELVW